MASPSIDMVGIEKQRQLLDENVAKLRQTLKHWQLWEAEYEGLKEELDTIAGDATADNLAEISKSYDGDLLNEKEIRDLTGLNQNSPRTCRQIKDLISRRQDYVQKNIDSVQRQYFAAEGKLEEFAFASAWNQAEDGLPLTDILEELDDEGNVVSSHLSQPEKAQSALVQSLRKAGVSEEEEKGTTDGDKSEPKAKDDLVTAMQVRPTSPITTAKRSKTTGDLPTIKANGDDEPRSPTRKKSVSFAADTKPAEELHRFDAQEKKVSFAPKVAVMPAADPPDTRSVAFSPQVEEIPPEPLGPPSPDVRAGAEHVSRDVQESLRPSFAAGEKVYEITDDEEPITSHVVIPDNESEEDARLRREMLEYHLNEVGNVVAQIDLDESMAETEEDHHSTSDLTSSEYVEEEDTPYTSDGDDDDNDEEEEDEFGRSKRSQISPAYRKRMLELQSKLIGNMGPLPSEEAVRDMDSHLDPQDVRRMVIRDKRSSTSSNADSESSEKKDAPRKRVSFAAGIDIAEPEPSIKARKKDGIDVGMPIADTVSERTSLFPDADTLFPTAAAPSSGHNKAQAEANSSHNTAAVVDNPTSSTGSPLVDTLIERSAANTVRIPDFDEHDPVAERRHLAAEYYRKRNELVKQQGGFKAETEEDPLMEERDGKVKKVSRFRAARLQGQ